MSGLLKGLARTLAALDGLDEVDVEGVLVEVARLHGMRIVRADRRPPIVYFIESQKFGLIKIGTTTNIDRRLARLSSDCGDRDLRVLAMTPGSFLKEREIQQRFETHRARGEWFRRGRELLEFIATLGSK